uniref:OPA3-like protein CG13603 n=1 Tax=Parastrongyloides trichosuri TaxID=131310 RepID=A0A0N4ZP52_PARTI
MGLPMVQVFMVMVRQMSKPIAERIMKYGKAHPLFRDKLLVPVGRKIINITRRIQLKRLGLKQTEEIAPIPEKEALEQASEVIQQIVIFTYTIVVLSAYHLYTSSKPSPKYIDEKTLDELCQKMQLENATLSKQIEELEKRLLFIGENTRLYDKKTWNNMCLETIKDIRISNIDNKTKEI